MKGKMVLLASMFIVMPVVLASVRVCGQAKPLPFEKGLYIQDATIWGGSVFLAARVEEDMHILEGKSDLNEWRITGRYGPETYHAGFVLIESDLALLLSDFVDGNGASPITWSYWREGHWERKGNFAKGACESVAGGSDFLVAAWTDWEWYRQFLEFHYASKVCVAIYNLRLKKTIQLRLTKPGRDIGSASPIVVRDIGGFSVFYYEYGKESRAGKASGTLVRYRVAYDGAVSKKTLQACSGNLLHAVTDRAGHFFIAFEDRIRVKLLEVSNTGKMVLFDVGEGRDPRLIMAKNNTVHVFFKEWNGTGFTLLHRIFRKGALSPTRVIVESMGYPNAQYEYKEGRGYIPLLRPDGCLIVLWENQGLLYGRVIR